MKEGGYVPVRDTHSRHFRVDFRPPPPGVFSKGGKVSKDTQRVWVLLRVSKTTPEQFYDIVTDCRVVNIMVLYTIGLPINISCISCVIVCLLAMNIH